MSMGKEETTQLWEAVEKGKQPSLFIVFYAGAQEVSLLYLADLALFQRPYQKLLHPTDRALVSVPLKIYLPAAAEDDSHGKVQAGHVRVVQSFTDLFS
jgi:hypothetical protein